MTIKEILTKGIIILIISSCGINKDLKIAEGSIISDNSGNAVYVPKNLKEKDLVYLTRLKKGDSLEYKSNFSRENVNISFINIGEQIDKDSINIRLLGKENYPIGLVKVNFFKDKEFVSSFSPLGGQKKAYCEGVNGFIVEVFGAKSEFIELNNVSIKDTLIISFDYLTPEQIERYTFINLLIPAKRK